MRLENRIPSVNFHLWEPCNMRCKFCFATFQDVKQSILPKGHLPKRQSIEVVKKLAEFGFEKITFAGGEPTLCPWLPELIETAKLAGMTTMIVSNGSKINPEFLSKTQNHLDWITLSIDSLDEHTNLFAGRAITGKKPLCESFYKKLVKEVKNFGFGLKINTVVNRTNYREDMSNFIFMALPKRWKIFQVLPIIGQNDSEIDSFIIGLKEFVHFLKTHRHLKNKVTIIAETNDDMKNSYVMVDPAGRFFDNSSGMHNYSKPIHEVGVGNALSQVSVNFEKFISRGGIYDWKKI